MFHRIALFKLADSHANAATRDALARALRAELERGGYDASVGVPADEASTRSWDLSLVVRLRTRELLTSFDAAAFVARHGGLPEGAVGFAKTWVFEG